MASRAGLRQPSCACGHSLAGLRQPGSAPVALASAPAAAASRLPPAAPLGHGATPVCLRRRARPVCSSRLPPAPRSASPLRRPGLSRPARIARYVPRHSRPSAPRPPLPRRRRRRSLSRTGERGGGTTLPDMQQAADSKPPAQGDRDGIPVDAAPVLRAVPRARRHPRRGGPAHTRGLAAATPPLP